MREDFGERVRKARASLPGGACPSTAVILGSGLSGIMEGAAGYEKISYGDIAEFPKPTVQGHAGVMYLSDKAAVMAGRFHYYEGHPMDNVVLPIFTLRAMGVKNIILTNAAGAVNASYKPGDIVLIKDHINMMGTSPFIGANPKGADGKDLGPRFFDMSTTYKADLRRLACECAGRTLPEGVYCAMTGPAYETPAEIRMLKAIGGDLVGMSTVPEALAANYLGMNVLGLSCVTNMAAGISETPLDHHEVVEVGKRVERELKALIFSLISRL